MANQFLSVRIVSPSEDVFSGEVLSVSSVNSAGPFDILPEHAKFVTLVEKRPLVLQLPSKEKKEFNFNLAIIHVRDNRVNIYINPTQTGQELTAYGQIRS